MISEVLWNLHSRRTFAVEVRVRDVGAASYTRFDPEPVDAHAGPPPKAAGDGGSADVQRRHGPPGFGLPKHERHCAGGPDRQALLGDAGLLESGRPLLHCRLPARHQPRICHHALLYRVVDSERETDGVGLHAMGTVQCLLMCQQNRVWAPSRPAHLSRPQGIYGCDK